MVAQKEAAEQDLLAFVRMHWHVVEPETPLIEGWPLEAMCDMLMAASDGDVTRVLLNVPPGFMKSLLLCVFWPAWEWGPCNMPHLRYISASYNSALPERDNGRFARIIQDPVYQQLWGDRVKLVRQGAGLVENSATGWKRASSTGGGTTGHRGDRILIDDANNPNDVESDDVRQSTIQWLREVMPDRLNHQERGVIINLQQRTHEQDATGTLAEFGSGYVWMSIPMEFDPLRMCSVVLRENEDGTQEGWTDPRGLDEDGNVLEGLYTDHKGELKVRMGSPMAKAEGTLAWPERFSAEACERLKMIKGAYAWSGQYQQSPTIRGGGVLRREWWNTWTARQFPDMGTTVLSVDTAYEMNKENDWNAIQGWGAFEGDAGTPNFILMGAWRYKAPLAQLVARIAEHAREIKADYILIEHKSRGRDVADELLRLYASEPWQIVLLKVSSTVDKIARLNAVTHFFSGDVRKAPATYDPATGEQVPGIDVWAGGMVWAPDTDWADEVINEVSIFPRGAHDDHVDCLSQFFAWARKNGVVLRSVEHEAIETEKKRFKRPQGVPYAL